MARTFDGDVANYFTASGLKYNLPTNCTIVFRAKTSTASGNITVMGRRDTISAAGFFVYRRGDRESAEVSLFGTGEIFNFAGFGSWPADGLWHDFILTKAGNSWTMYVDSTTAIATGSGAYFTTSGPDLGVGILIWESNSPVSAFNGSLDDVAIFPVVLDATDRASYLGGTAASALTAAGADHYWPMSNAAAGGETDGFGSADLTETGTVGYENTSGGLSISLDAGSYSISGQAVTTRATRLMDLSPGSYSWAGQDISLIYTQPGVYILPLDPGSYVITGSDALIDLSMVLAAGAYSIGGQSVDFTIGVPAAYSIPLNPGSYNWSGKSIALRWSGEPVSTTKLQKISVSIGARIG